MNEKRRGSQAPAIALATPEDVSAVIRRLAAETEGLDLAAVAEESRLEDDLGMDSLGVVQFQMAVEEAFGVEIDHRTASSIRTVREATEAVLDALRHAGP